MFDSILEKYLNENNILQQIDDLKKRVSQAPPLQQNVIGAAAEAMSDASSKKDPKLLELANSIQDKILNNKQITPEELEVLSKIFPKDEEQTEDENKEDNSSVIKSTPNIKTSPTTSSPSTFKNSTSYKV
jgi:hypothetical protein